MIVLVILVGVASVFLGQRKTKLFGTVCVVPQGCTGVSAFSPNGVITSGTTATSPLVASSTPSVVSINATSSAATSTFAGGISAARIVTTGNVGIGSTTPAQALSVTGIGAFSNFVYSRKENSGNFACLGGCTASTFPGTAGSAVEGIAYNGGSGCHFQSTEVLPTVSMDVYCANGDVYSDGYGVKVVYGGLTATIMDTYGVVPLRSPAFATFIGPANFGIGTSTPHARFALVSQSIATTTMAIVPALNQTAHILDIYGTNGVLKSVILSSGDVGLSTTSPFATLSVSASTTTIPFVISTTTPTVASSTLFMIDRAGNPHFGGGVPALSSCGTAPTLDGTSNDTVGSVTFGATASGCTITFSVPKASKPHCIVSTEAVSLVNAYTVTETASALTITQAASGGVSFDYLCVLGY